jgi:hypothetical protein
LTGEAIAVAGEECEKLSYGVGSGGDIRLPMGTLWGRDSISRVRLKSKGFGKMGCDGDDEEKVNPMVEFVEVIGKGSVSKLMEGCRLTLSAISFVQRVARHPER